MRHLNAARQLSGFVALVVVHGWLTPAKADVHAVAEANRVAEISFTAARPHDDPFNDVELDVVFTTPDGAKMRVPAFWAGGNVWKARYASPTVGTHQFRSECSHEQDAGLHGVRGRVEVTPYTGTNPFFKHGPIRVAANNRYFEHTDGTPFFWLADTWWMGLCHRLHWPEEVKTLAADRKDKGFNVIQIVAGLYPDMHPFDPRGANEAGFPWEENYARIRPEYFDAADKRLQFLVDEGFTPCIVGAWGYFMPWMGVEKVNQHWRYLIARYGAMPVVWCGAGEANLPWYLAKGFPYDDRKQVDEWTEVLRYIRATDPFHRPLTIHPTGIGRLSARHCTHDAALLDFDMLQTPHGQRDAVEPTVRTVRESYADKPTLPVIDGEAAYEMLSDTLPTKWTRQMFWLCMTGGAAGHTYGANGIWQCNRRGQPHGPSPHHQGGVGYGAIPWDKAMNLPGSRQVGLGKKLFEKYEWQWFEPHPEWAENAYRDGSGPSWKQWIWYPEGEPATDAPAGKRYFRKTFNALDAHRGVLWLSVDDKFVAYLNGERIGERTGWQSAQPINKADGLRKGRNVLAIEAENLPGPPSANPAGLIASLLVQTDIGETYENIASDGTWKCAKQLTNGDADWTSLDFDDSSWAAAKVLRDYGEPPWGQISKPDDYGPFAVGIPGKVRIIYSPGSPSIAVRKLEANAKYSVQVFDPTTGEIAALPTIVEGENPPAITNPKADGEDWVLVLERVE